MIRHPLFHEVSTNPAGILSHEFHARYIYVYIYVCVSRTCGGEELDGGRDARMPRGRSVVEINGGRKKRDLISPMIDALSLITLLIDTFLLLHYIVCC